MLGEIVRLDKVKRPGGTYWFEMRLLDHDEHGVWLAYLEGCRWRAPHEPGVMPFDAVVLVDERRPFVSWWVDDPDDRRVEIDIGLPPQRTEHGWSFVDLELDPIRHERDGRVEVEDGDEFAHAVAEGWIAPADAELATGAAQSMERALREGAEPWSALGWRRLEEARAARVTLLRGGR